MIKKIIHRLLCNPATGGLIKACFGTKIPDLRWRGYAFDVSNTGMHNTIVASIFWGFYESSEIRFVQKHFKGDVDAIELGASSGVVSSHIISKLNASDRRYIGVEANKNLAEAWHKNVQRHNPKNIKVQLLNYAVYYDADTVTFGISNNTTASRLSDSHNADTQSVTLNAITLKHLLSQEGIADYALFCDIEGAEAQILVNETTAFDKCKYLFIELHQTTYRSVEYTSDALAAIIQQKGFTLIDQHGPVYYFSR